MQQFRPYHLIPVFLFVSPVFLLWGLTFMLALNPNSMTDSDLDGWAAAAATVTVFCGFLTAAYISYVEGRWKF